MNMVEKYIVAVCVAMLTAGVRAADSSSGGSTLTVGSGTNETHVMAKRADYDISKNILVLDGNVPPEPADDDAEPEELPLAPPAPPRLQTPRGAPDPGVPPHAELSYEPDLADTGAPAAP